MHAPHDGLVLYAVKINFSFCYKWFAKKMGHDRTGSGGTDSGGSGHNFRKNELFFEIELYFFSDLLSFIEICELVYHGKTYFCVKPTFHILTCYCLKKVAKTAIFGNRCIYI